MGRDATGHKQDGRSGVSVGVTLRQWGADDGLGIVESWSFRTVEHPRVNAPGLPGAGGARNGSRRIGRPSPGHGGPRDA